MKTLKLFIALVVVLTTSKINAQSLAWAQEHGGTGFEAGYGVATDASGNVYTVGSFSGSCNFDPGGLGTTSVSAGSDDICLVKRNSAGIFQWVKTIGSTSSDVGRGIFVDASAIYITGSFQGTVDFDPGAGVINLTSTAVDAFVLKLDVTTGNFIWVKNFTGPGNEISNAVAVNAAGEVYTTGSFNLTADFDPSAATYTLSAGGANQTNTDIFISKLNASGNFMWAYEIGSTTNNYNESGNDVSLDNSGNVYLTGNIFGPGVIDLAPGAPTQTVSSTGNGVNAFYLKLSSLGAYQYGGEIGGVGNDLGQGIDADASGGCVFTGYTSSATIDLNPSPTATNNATSGGGTNDMFVVKISPTNNYSWGYLFGSTTDDQGRKAYIDASNNIFLTGSFSGTVDFDPGAGTDNHTAFGGVDIFILKLSSAGALLWAVDVGAGGTDIGYDIITDAAGNIYNTGYFTGNSGDFDPGAGVVSLTYSAGGDAYTLKLLPCATPVLTVSSTASVCAGATATLSASGATTYSWSTGATTANISTNPTITTVYTVTGTNGVCSSSTTKTVSVVANPTVNITAPSSTVCSGAPISLTASGASTYSWSTGATTTSVSVSPTITTVYTATGTAVNSCKDTQTISITVIAGPTVNISTSSPTACAGTTVNLTASGATTYTWSTGATTTLTTVSPTITTVYTATGTAANSCKDTQTISISVTANPTVGVSASSPSICSGSTVTLTATGATTYSWSTTAFGSTTTVNPLNTTTYTVTGYAGVSLSSCKSTQTISINVTPTPTLVTNNYTICAGGTATLTSSGATTYSWNTGATTTSITVTPTSNITYTVTGFNGTCTDVNTVSVTVGSALSIAITPSVPSICIGNSGTLTASGATSYTWNTGPNTSSLIVTPTITTNYTVNGTNGTCAGTKTITVIVNSNPTVTASSSSSVICTGNSATLSATGATSYNWNPGSLSGTSVAVSPTINTTYTVVGSNAAGCTNTKTVAVTVSACTGIQEQVNQNSFILYPNPAKASVNVKLSNNTSASIQIMDVTGKFVTDKTEMKDEININTSELKSGLYFVIISSEGKTSTSKLIID